MMYFEVPILAHDCVFNRHATENKSRYFETVDELVDLAINLDPSVAERTGAISRNGNTLGKRLERRISRFLA